MNPDPDRLFAVEHIDARTIAFRCRGCDRRATFVAPGTEGEVDLVRIEHARDCPIVFAFERASRAAWQ